MDTWIAGGDREHSSPANLIRDRGLPVSTAEAFIPVSTLGIVPWTLCYDKASRTALDSIEPKAKEANTVLKHHLAPVQAVRETHGEET